MYRALAWSVDQAGLVPRDTPALREHLARVEIRLDGERVRVDGRDVTGEIRTPHVSRLTSALTALGPVREALTPLQRRLAGAGGVILEGRDTGTVVCPEAEVKFYLDASLEERARRRQAELRAGGVELDLETVRQDIETRDRQDRTRALAPLRPAPDAITVDSTQRSVEEVVALMLETIERKRCCTPS
jgi:cytidylate kinase